MPVTTIGAFFGEKSYFRGQGNPQISQLNYNEDTGG